MAKFKVDPPAFKKREEKQDKGKGEVPSGGLKKGAKPCKKCGGSHIPPHPHFK